MYSFREKINKRRYVSLKNYETPCREDMFSLKNYETPKKENMGLVSRIMLHPVEEDMFTLKNNEPPWRRRCIKSQKK